MTITKEQLEAWQHIAKAVGLDGNGPFRAKHRTVQIKMAEPRHEMDEEWEDVAVVHMPGGVNDAPVAALLAIAHEAVPALLGELVRQDKEATELLGRAVLHEGRWQRKHEHVCGVLDRYRKQLCTCETDDEGNVVSPNPACVWCAASEAVHGPLKPIVLGKKDEGLR